MQEVNISPNNFEQCLKCNLCTTVCPMMAVNPHYPGPKQAGPDGERYRLKDPAFFDLTLKYCLNCKRCEVACPSGVNVGDIIQSSRLKYGHQSHPIRDTVLASTDLVGTIASPMAPLVNSMLNWKPVKGMMSIFGVDSHRKFPSYSRLKFTEWYKSQASEQKKFRKFITYFHGCYVNYNYPRLGMDLIKLMNACGYGVRIMEEEKCCGVALISNGMGRKAKRNGNTNLNEMRRALSSGSEAILTSSSTCTFTIRDEYKHILGMDNDDIRTHLMLATKFIFDRVESGDIKLAFREDWKGNYAYHTACHMQKLGWAIYSTGLLSMIPEMELKILPQECCGIAGTFGFKKENYSYSQLIGTKIFDVIKESHAWAVITDCETCKWQIEMSTGYSVFNPISILADALDIEKTAALNYLR